MRSEADVNSAVVLEATSIDHEAVTRRPDGHEPDLSFIRLLRLFCHCLNARARLGSVLERCFWNQYDMM